MAISFSGVLSGIGSAISSTASKVRNIITGLGSSQAANVSGAMSSAPNLQSNRTYNPNITSYQTQQPATAVFNPSTGKTNTFDPKTGANLQNNMTPVPRDAQGNVLQASKQTTYDTKSPNRNYANMSTSSKDRAIYDEFGRKVVDAQGNRIAYSGISGASGSSYSDLFNYSSFLGAAGGAGVSPFGGASGISGTGGGPNFLGIGASSGGPQSASGVPDDQRDRTQTDTRTLPQGSNINLFRTMAPAFIPPTSAGKPLNVSVPEIINAGEIASTPERTAVLNSTVGTQTAQSVATQIQQNLYNEMAKETPIPAAPVTETPEQVDFLSQFDQAESFDIRAEMDSIRENLGLPDLEREKLELANQVRAINRAYDPVIKDIKDNPNLPAALAQRRLQAISEQQKEQINRLTDLLDSVNEAIDLANTRLNQEFNILTAQMDEEERRRDNNMAKLKLLMETGAIGGLNDTEVAQLAKLTGVASSSIKKARDAALTPDIDVITSEDAAGNLRGINKNTGEILWTAKGVGTPSSTGSGAPNLNQVMQSLPSFEQFVRSYAEQGNKTVFIADKESLRPAYNKYVSDIVQKNYKYSQTDVAKLVAAGKVGASFTDQMSALTANSSTSIIGGLGLDLTSLKTADR